MLFAGAGTINDFLGDFWKYNPPTELSVIDGWSSHGNQARVYGVHRLVIPIDRAHRLDVRRVWRTQQKAPEITLKLLPLVY